MPEELAQYPNIYLVGKAGSGKSTVANMLVSEFGYRRTALADGVKLGVDSLLNNYVEFKDYIKSVFSANKKQRKAAHKAYKEAHANWGIFFAEKHRAASRGRVLSKKDYRAFMQWWGTDICRAIDEDIWVDYYLRNTFDFEAPLVCDDVRFANEEFALNANDYVGIHIARDVHGNNLTETQATHVSEQYEPAYCQYVINNDGDLEQLNSRVHEIMEAIVNEHK